MILTISRRVRYASENSSPPIFRFWRNCSSALSRHFKCSCSRASELRYGFGPPHTASIIWWYVSLAATTAARLLASAVAYRANTIFLVISHQKGSQKSPSKKSMESIPTSNMDFGSGRSSPLNRFI